MTTVYCAVVGCHNSTYQLNKWKNLLCEIHGVEHRNWTVCTCEPPFCLLPLPTMNRDPNGRSKWIANIGRSDLTIDCPKSVRICSSHFIDGKPSELNPYPTLHMGYKDRKFMKQKVQRAIVKHSLEKNVTVKKFVEASANTTDYVDSLEEVIEEEHDGKCMEILTTNSQDVVIEQLRKRIAHLEKELEVQQCLRKAVHRPANLFLLSNDKQVLKEKTVCICEPIMKMDSMKLQWPGLWEVNMFIVDFKTRKLYSTLNPLPPQKQHLDTTDNRYVRLSEVLNLFTDEMRDEAEWTLREIQKSYNFGKVFHSTVTELKSGPDGDRVERRVTTYISVASLMVFAVIWPFCKPFQALRNTLLSYLDNYAESVCLDCGFVRRECMCRLPETGLSGSSRSIPLTFVGHAVMRKDQSIQTEAPSLHTPMHAAIKQGNSQPGISVLLPPGLQIQPGIRFPVTLSQTPLGNEAGQMINSPVYYTHSSNANANAMALNSSHSGASFSGNANGGWSTNYISVPPIVPSNSFAPISFSLGQPALVSPLVSSSESSLMDARQALQLTGRGGLESSFTPGQSILLSNGSPGVNFMRPPVNLLPTNTSLLASDNVDFSSTRKRKYEGERPLEGLADVGVQTTAKSFIKKVKLRMGKLAVDSTTGEKEEPGKLEEKSSPVKATTFVPSVSTIDTPSKPSIPIPPISPIISTKTVNSTASAAADTSKKEEKSEVAAEKKFTTVWKLIETISDSEENEELEKVEQKETVSSEKDKATTESSDATSYELALRTQRDAADVAESLIKLSGQGEMSELLHHAGSDNTSCHTSLSRGLKSVAFKKSCDNLSQLVIDETRTTEEAESLPVKDTVWSERNGLVSDSSVDKDLRHESSKSLAAEVSGLNKQLISTETSTHSEVVSGPRTLQPSDDDGKQQRACDVHKQLDGDDRESHEKEPKSAKGANVKDSSEETPQAYVKRKKVYAKFEYAPTGEHILRCLVSKCSQTFDTKVCAELHNAVHPGLGSAKADDGHGGASLTYFQCDHCDFRAPFYHWYDLLRHMSQKHGIRMVDKSVAVTCELCGLGFESEDKLASHLDFHYSNRYKCVYCGLLLLTWGQIQRHLDNCAEKSKQHRGGGTNLGCPFCTFVFHKKNIRNLHLLSHIDSGLSCALCDDSVVWTDWKSLRKHYQQKHAKIMNDKISPFIHDLPNRQPPLKCNRPGCDLTFKTMILFGNHMTKVHDLVPYTLIECIQCERSFRTEKSHEWHVRHMHGEERLCDKCDFVASSKAMLKLHIIQKHQEKQHTCSECDKSFLYFHQLRIHMAHHARRTIYPCRRCDLEFNRHADLRQHLRQEHRQTSTGAAGSVDAVENEPPSGHDCPECEFHAATRAAVVQHVRKMHPELADGAVEPKEEGREHSYFTRKVDELPKQLTPPPVPLSPPSPLQPVQFVPTPTAYRPHKVYAKRGRRRRLNAPTVEKDHADRYPSLAADKRERDRRERRIIKQQEKEHLERVKRLRKWTCARSRTFDEHREMGRGNILAQPRVSRPTKDDGTDAGDVFDPLMKALPRYPILDHDYARQEIERGADRLQALWNGGYNRSAAQRPESNQLPQMGSIPQEVSAFQECETAILGLRSPPSRGGGRGGRRGRGRGRGSFGLDRRVSSGGVLPLELDQLDPDIRDLDLLAESELLLRPAGDYSIIQDILGPGTGGVNAARKIPAGFHLGQSPMKLPNVGASGVRGVTESLHRARLTMVSAGATDNGLSDGLPLDETAATTDLDDIELCEDDYRLFDSTNESNADTPVSSSAAHFSSSQGSELRDVSSGVVGSLWKNGMDSSPIRLGGSFVHRTSVLNSNTRVVTESLGSNNMMFYSRGMPSVGTARAMPGFANLGRPKEDDCDDDEDSESEASAADSAAELDTSTDTASRSSPRMDRPGSSQSMSDLANGDDEVSASEEED